MRIAGPILLKLSSLPGLTRQSIPETVEHVLNGRGMDARIKPGHDDSSENLRLPMLALYVRAMDALQRVCMIIAGACLVVITIIIPWGVFTRYVLGYGSSWPEPMAVLMMIWFSFMAAAVCYREGLHIGVQHPREAC